MPPPACSTADSAAAAALPGRGSPPAGFARLYVSLVCRAWPAFACTPRARVSNRGRRRVT